MNIKSETTANNDIDDKNNKNCIMMEELQSSKYTAIQDTLIPVDKTSSSQNTSDEDDQSCDESELANNNSIDVESTSNERLLDKMVQTQNILSDGLSSCDNQNLEMMKTRKKQIYSNDIVESVSIRENFQIRRERWDEAARTLTPEGLIPSELPSDSNRRKSPPLSCMNRLHIANWTNSSNRLAAFAHAEERPALNQNLDQEVEMFDVSDLDIQSMMEDENENENDNDNEDEGRSSEKSQLIAEFVSKSLSNIENNINHLINMKSSSEDEHVSFDSMLSETKLVSHEYDLESEDANNNELDKIITGLSSTSLGMKDHDKNASIEPENEIHYKHKDIAIKVITQKEKENHNLNMIKQSNRFQKSDERYHDNQNDLRDFDNEENQKNNRIEATNFSVQADNLETNESPHIIDNNVSVLIGEKDLENRINETMNDNGNDDAMTIDNNESGIEFSENVNQNPKDNLGTTATLINESDKDGDIKAVNIKDCESLELEVDPTSKEDDDASSQSLNSTNVEYETNGDENEIDAENELIMPNLSALVDDEEGDNFPLYSDASTEKVITVQMDESDTTLQPYSDIPSSPNQYSSQQSFHDEDSVDVFSASTNPVSNVTHPSKQPRYVTDHYLHEIPPEDIVRPSASFESDIQDLVVESSDIPPPSPHSTTFPEKIECWGGDLNSVPQIPRNEDFDYVHTIRVKINQDAQNIIDIEDIDGRPYALEPEIDEELMPRITDDGEPSLSMRVETSFNKDEMDSIEGSSMDEKRTASTTESIELDDLQFSKYPHRTSLSNISPLPNSDYVNDTGVIYTRVSWRSLLMRKWRRCVWLHYGRASLYLFRTEEDVNSWLLNQTLTFKQRNDLIKVKFEFRDEVRKSHVRGYKLTTTKKKAYDKNGPL